MWLYSIILLCSTNESYPVLKTFFEFFPLLYSVSSFYIPQFAIKFHIFVIISLDRIIIAFASAIDFLFWLKKILLNCFFFLLLLIIYIKIYFATFDPLFVMPGL